MKIKEILDTPCDISYASASMALEKFQHEGKLATIMRVSPIDKKFAGDLHKMSRFNHLLLQVDASMEEDSWYIGDEHGGYGSKGT